MRSRVLMLAIAALMILGAVPALADDQPTPDGAPESADQRELGAGAIRITTLLARHFNLVITEPDGDPIGVPADVANLNDDLGFGDLFKINLFLAAGGDVELLKAACADESGCEFAWGEWFRDLDLPSGPRNLGQLISAEKRGHGRPEHAASHDKPADRAERGNSGNDSR